MKPLISICVNVDSRPGVDGQNSSMVEMGEGTRSWDYLTHSIRAKHAFFYGFEREMIVLIDEHLKIPDAILNEVRELADTVVIRKHSNYYRGGNPSTIANDIRFLQCMTMATGEIICKMDADTMCFSRDEEVVSQLIGMLADHRFISYPSQWSPDAITDPSFGGRTWASTRFSLFRREHFQFDVLERCLRDPEWAYATYGDSPKKCNWLEHMISLVNENDVFYPPRVDDKILVWCWNHYVSGVAEKLNAMTFDQVLGYVRSCGGIVYPNDVHATPL